MYRPVFFFSLNGESFEHDSAVEQSHFQTDQAWLAGKPN